MMQKKLYVNKEKPISFGYVKLVTVDNAKKLYVTMGKPNSFGYVKLVTVDNAKKNFT
jgi:hypothetical protein